MLPEAGDGDGDDGVYAVLVNANGDMFETQDGLPAIMSVPVVGIEKFADPNEVIKGWVKIAQHLGVSVPTAKRMEEDGRLPKARRRSERQVRYQRKTARWIFEGIELLAVLQLQVCNGSGGQIIEDCGRLEQDTSRAAKAEV